MRPFRLEDQSRYIPSTVDHAVSLTDKTARVADHAASCFSQTVKRGSGSCCPSGLVTNRGQRIMLSSGFPNPKPKLTQESQRVCGSCIHCLDFHPRAAQRIMLRRSLKDWSKPICGSPFYFTNRLKKAKWPPYISRAAYIFVAKRITLLFSLSRFHVRPDVINSFNNLRS